MLHPISGYHRLLGHEFEGVLFWGLGMRDLEDKRYWCQIMAEEAPWNCVKKSGFCFFSSGSGVIAPLFGEQ